MDANTFRKARLAYTIVLTLALLGFAWRGILPEGMGAYAAMDRPEGYLFRAVSWMGFTVTLGFIMLPWWPWRWGAESR